MMTFDLYSDITAWLSKIPPNPKSSSSQGAKLDDDNNSCLPQDLPDLSIPASSLLLNSLHRSNWELLRALPAPSHMEDVLPSLPTQALNAFDLVQSLPHEINNPVVSCTYFFAVLANNQCYDIDMPVVETESAFCHQGRMHPCS
jgi:hypothetical protein